MTTVTVYEKEGVKISVERHDGKHVLKMGDYRKEFSRDGIHQPHELRKFCEGLLRDGFDKHTVVKN